MDILQFDIALPRCSAEIGDDERSRFIEGSMYAKTAQLTADRVIHPSLNDFYVIRSHQ